MATRNLNKVMLIGNLTRDPELRFTPQGNAVSSFVVATNREWVSQGEKKQSVDFHNVVSWNKLAEICGELLKKGMRVYVEGRLQTRDWEDTDGKKRYKTETVIDDMIILTPKGYKSSSSSSEDFDGEELEDNTGADEVSGDEEINLDEIDLDDLGDLDTGSEKPEEDKKDKKKKK
ncbi:MAG: single-stranded DNA-binding protein [Patescibacteria group bacterium]|nr:single-stranded DNA-binding protein [Patescibacteria group bacterium]